MSALASSPARLDVDPSEVRTGYSCLSDKAICQHIERQSIVIQPFDMRNLNTSSYDVSLGEWFCREQGHLHGNLVYNIWSREDTDRVWGQPEQALSAMQYFEAHPLADTTGVDLSSDRVISIKPGETILGHTVEFIGGRGSVTSMMKARSSAGRNFIAACQCAGQLAALPDALLLLMTLQPLTVSACALQGGATWAT